MHGHRLGGGGEEGWAVKSVGANLAVAHLVGEGERRGSKLNISRNTLHTANLQQLSPPFPPCQR
jgi:hypothetical protein